MRLRNSGRVLNLTPSCETYKSASVTGIPPDKTLDEFIDNAIDTMYMTEKINRPIENPTIKVIFDNTKPHKSITIEDNMGGIPSKRVEEVLTLGYGCEKSGKGIGAWGMGAKLSPARLGGKWSVVSWFRDEDFGTITDLVLDEMASKRDGASAIGSDTFIRDSNGEGTYDKDELPMTKGSTRFVLQDLNNEGIYTETFMSNFAKQCGEVYGEILKKNPKLKIQVVHRENGKKDFDFPLEPVVLENHVQRLISGWYSPSPQLDYIDTSVLTSDDICQLIDSEVFKIITEDGKSFILLDDAGNIRLRIVVGLSWASHHGDGFGADIYYNERRLITNNKIAFEPKETYEMGEPSDEGLVTGYKYNRLRAYIFAWGPEGSTFGINTKADVDENSPLWCRLQGIMRRLYGHYKVSLDKYNKKMNILLRVQKDVVQKVSPGLPAPPDLEEVKVPRVGEDMDTKIMSIYPQVIAESIKEWKKDKSKAGLVAYVTENFLGNKKKSPVTLAPKRTRASDDKKLSIRLTNGLDIKWKKVQDNYSARKGAKKNPKDAEVFRWMTDVVLSK